MKEKFLKILRDRSTSRVAFREAADKLGILMAEEIHVEKATLVPILRAGIALLHPFQKKFPAAPIGFLGIRRDEKTALPHLYYENLPPLTEQILILDPMLATGGSANLAIDRLKSKGAKHIHLISVIASRDGIEAIKKRHQDIKIYSVAIDETLDADKFIVPGLGDFGDRYFS
jgi:uracil phosphoribosyltransferase